MDEGALHVVVDDLGTAAWSLAHLFFVRGIALDAEADFFQASVFQDLFGHVAVFDVFEEPVGGGRGILNLILGPQ